MEVAEMMDTTGRRLRPLVIEHDPGIVVSATEYTWPPTLAIEIAMAAAKPKVICEAYGIEREEWDRIRANPAFISEYTGACEMLRQEGASFKVRAQMQAGEFLKELWRIAHDPGVSVAVRVDVMKHVIRIAGLDASKDQGSLLGKVNGGGGGGFALNIILGDNHGTIGG